MSQPTLQFRTIIGEVPRLLECNVPRDSHHSQLLRRYSQLPLQELDCCSQQSHFRPLCEEHWWNSKGDRVSGTAWTRSRDRCDDGSKESDL